MRFDIGRKTRQFMLTGQVVATVINSWRGRMSLALRGGTTLHGLEKSQQRTKVVSLAMESIRRKSDACTRKDEYTQDTMHWCVL
jgi:hypothetical protein